MILEVCVDTLKGLHAAHKGGADRIELCAALSEGGLTPSPGMMQAAADLSTPSHVMIRPRGGDFCYSDDEHAVMLADIAAARAHGLAGVVFGALAPEGDLDMARLEPMLRASDGLFTTLHRAVDLTADPLAAVEEAVALGFDCILTSGAAVSAPAGAEVIAQMVRASAGRIQIMAGAGLSPENVVELARKTRAPAYHGSCRAPLPGTADRLGFTPEAGRSETSAAIVAQMRALIVQA